MIVVVSSVPESETLGIKIPLLSAEISRIAEESGGDPSVLIDTFCERSNCVFKTSNNMIAVTENLGITSPILDWGN